MAKLASAFIGVPGFEVWINYNDANMRLGSIDWLIPDPQIIVNLKVWNNDNLVVDRTENTDGSENVPGVHTLVEEIDPDDPGNSYLALPNI